MYAKCNAHFQRGAFARVCLGNAKFLGWWGLPGRLGETQSDDLQSPFTTEHMASNRSASRATKSHVCRKLFDIPKSGQVGTWPTWLMTMALVVYSPSFPSISPLLLPLLPTPLQHSPICTSRPLNLITIFFCHISGGQHTLTQGYVFYHVPCTSSWAIAPIHRHPAVLFWLNTSEQRPAVLLSLNSSEQIWNENMEIVRCCQKCQSI